MTNNSNLTQVQFDRALRMLQEVSLYVQHLHLDSSHDAPITSKWSHMPPSHRIANNTEYTAIARAAFAQKQSRRRDWLITVLDVADTLMAQEGAYAWAAFILRERILIRTPWARILAAAKQAGATFASRQYMHKLYQYAAREVAKEAKRRGFL